MKYYMILYKNFNKIKKLNILNLNILFIIYLYIILL